MYSFILFTILVICQLFFLSCSKSPEKDKAIVYLGVTKNLYGLENAVIHTIDDYSLSLPPFLDYLDGFKVKSTIFIDRTHLIPDSVWERLNKAYLSGNEIGSHTRHHTFINLPVNEKTASVLLNDLELKGSFNNIISHTSQPWVWSFAYPGGEGFQFVSVRKRIQDAGYIAARRFTGFIDMDENWKTCARNDFDGKSIPPGRYAIEPDKESIRDYEGEIRDFLKVIKKQHRFMFVTHPKGLGDSDRNNLHNFLKYLDSLADTWFVPLGYYAQYRTLCESVRVENKETGGHSMSLKITNALPDSVYNVPVTFCLKVRFVPKVVAHDNINLSPGVALPWQIKKDEFYFLRNDSLFITVKPRGNIAVELDSANSIGAGYGDSPTAFIIKTAPDDLFSATTSLNSSAVEPYTRFRNSILNRINSLKSSVPLGEEKARKITFLYYRIGELDSAFKYLEQSGTYDAAFAHCAKTSISISRVVLWQRDAAASDSVINTVLTFSNPSGREKLVMNHAQLLYDDGREKSDLRFISGYDMNSALNLLRSLQEPSFDNLLLQTKCIEFLVNADSSAKSKSTLRDELFDSYCVLGQRCVQNERLIDAIQHFKKAIRINPLNPEVYNDLGVVYDMKDLLPEAIESFQNAIQLNPKFALAHYNLARIYFKAGARKECLASLKECLRLGYNEISPAMLQLLEESRR